MTQTMKFVDVVARALRTRESELEAWFARQRRDRPLPFHTSFDIRHSGYKVAVVDANVFPEGFANLGENSHALAAQAAKEIIDEAHREVRSIALIAELNLRNGHYWDSIHVLEKILARAGFDVTVGFAGDAARDGLEVQSYRGATLRLTQFSRRDGHLVSDHAVPDLIVLNNDFSRGDPALLHGIRQRVTPSIDLCWHRRRKHSHFAIQRELIQEVAAILDVDWWRLTSDFDFQDDVDFRTRRNFDAVAGKVDAIVTRTGERFAQCGVEHEPFVFVKGNFGAYGMNALPVRSGAEFLSISHQQRERMRRAKGGAIIDSLLLQEGVYTRDTCRGCVAEPVIYCVGDRPIGGFFRLHAARSASDNLNRPGMEFDADVLCAANPSAPRTSNIDANAICVYHFLARVGVIATAKELALLEDGTG